MPYVRFIQYFFLKNLPHPKCYIPSIAKKFAILLQCNSKGRIALQQYCKIYIYYSTFPKISLSSLSLFLFSSPSSFSLSHLLSPLFRPKHHHPPNISNNNNDNSFLYPLSQPNLNSNLAAAMTMTTTQFLAILHYATSRVVPQQTLAQINLLQHPTNPHQRSPVFGSDVVRFLGCSDW